MRRVFAVGVCVALSIAGCQAVVGDFALERDEHADAATAAQKSDCEDGAFRCNAEFLLRCRNQSWELATTCAAPDQCDARQGRCMPCGDGEVRCNGAQREACMPDRSGWQRIAGAEGDCGSAAQCNPTFCGKCPSEGAVQCSAGNADDPDAQATTLQRCAGGQWQAIDVCASQSLCARSAERATMEEQAPTACEQPSCTAGQLACDDATLQRCPPTRERWTTVDSCASAALCRAVLADTAATKAAATLESCAPRCAPAGSYFCAGQVLRRCADDQTGFEDVMTCPAGRTCDVARGECRGPCSAGAMRCNHAILERCTSHETWDEVATCSSAGLCRAERSEDGDEWTGECVDPPAGCTAPGVFRCEGATLLRCTNDQTSWESHSECLDPALCDAQSGRCREPACAEAGAMRCNPALPQQLQRCRDNLTGWDDVGDACPSGSTCNADPSLGPACLSECPETPRRCLGTDRQVCDDDDGQPVWTSVATCATSALCECGLSDSCAAGLRSNGCGIPLCGGSRPDYRCDGDTLETCAPSRNGWAQAQTCATDPRGALCFTQYTSSNGSETRDVGRCLGCPIAAERRCFDAALRECAADRLRWNDVTAMCEFGCAEDVATPDRDYCATPECEPPARRCGPGSSTTAYQVCTASGTWSDAVTCDANTPVCGPGGACGCGVDADCPEALPACDDGVCQVCADDALRCRQGELERCTDHAWLDDPTCDFNCDPGAAEAACGHCANGDDRCGGGGDYERCAGGTWQLFTDCDGAEVCDAAQDGCVAPM